MSIPIELNNSSELAPLSFLRCGLSKAMLHSGLKPWNVGCGEAITQVRQLYRCTHCDVPFHKECLQKHFTATVTEADVEEAGLSPAKALANRRLSSNRPMKVMKEPECNGRFYPTADAFGGNCAWCGKPQSEHIIEPERIII